MFSRTLFIEFFLENGVTCVSLNSVKESNIVSKVCDDQCC